MEKIEIKINDKKYHVLVANTESEKEIGLSNIESMDDDEGMLFKYDRPQHVIFWMKDTTIPLDIIFINNDNEVISVKKRIPLSEEYIEEDNVLYVLELNQNSNIKSEDEIEFEDFDDSDVNTEMYVIGSNGKPQYTLVGGERIISRKETKVLIKKAKEAYKSKDDKDYKDLGRYIFNVFEKQDNRSPEYVIQNKKGE